MLLRYDRSLVESPTIRQVWQDFDRRLEALPNAVDESRTTQDGGYTQSIGLGVAVELGGIPVMLKVHDKYSMQETRSWVVDAFRAATDAYASIMLGSS